MKTIEIKVVDSTSGTVIHTLLWPLVPPPGAVILISNTRYLIQEAVWQEEEEMEVARNTSAAGCSVTLTVIPQ